MYNRVGKRYFVSKSLCNRDIHVAFLGEASVVCLMYYVKFCARLCG